MGFGPTVRLKRKVPFDRSSAGFGFTCTFDQPNTDRESGVAVSLSANKRKLERVVKPSLSKKRILMWLYWPSQHCQ